MEISTAPIPPAEKVPSYYNFRCILQNERGEVHEGWAEYTSIKKTLTWKHANNRVCFPVYWMHLPEPRR